MNKFGSCILVTFALLNSLIEAKEIIDFLNYLLPALSYVALKVQKAISEMSL